VHRFIGLTAAIVSLAGVGSVGLLFASAAGTTTGRPVKVTLAQPTCSRYSLVPQPTGVKGGQITFVVSNKGNLGHNGCPGEVGLYNTPEAHELVVLKTNLPPGKLPLTQRGGYAVAVEVGRVAPALVVNPGQTRSVTLTLKPGRYVLICNLIDHYQAGQYSAFVVSG
jgi:uncharacterized cupredoxin-like copper-binding protein